MDESLQKASEQATRQILEATVLQNPYLQFLTLDNAKLNYFLSLLQLEVFYGGQAGGGKTTALLAAALQFVQMPGYNALLLRRSFKDLSMPGSLIPKSHEWLAKSDAHWDGSEYKWTFPSGAVLKFGYLESANDIYQYRSSEFSFIGFDELTTFLESSYLYLFSRLRASKSVGVPLRMRSGSNPGGIGHQWVKERFVVGGLQKGHVFVPASLKDNTHIDANQYIQSLMHLPPVVRAQLMQGDWSAAESALFQRDWFKTILPIKPANIRNWVRFWDLAATAPKPGTDPDYTAGCLIGMHEGIIYIADMKRGQLRPRDIETLIKQTAITDGRSVRIRMEEEKGSAGKNLIDHYGRHILAGYDFAGTKPTGDPFTVAGPLASAAQAGNVALVRGPWNTAFLDELETFPGAHDDQVKSACLGLQEVVARPAPFRLFIPQNNQPKQLPAG